MQNYLIAYRNFKQNKSSFLINLLGLSTGLACAVLIYLWVNDELNIDAIHDNRLLQIISNHDYSSGINTNKATTGMLEQTLALEMPEIERIACYVNYSENISLTIEGKNLKGSGKLGSKDFFHVFSFPLLLGDIDKVLIPKDAIVISEELALNIFGSAEKSIGKSIEIGHSDKYIITGVFENIGRNSSLKFDFLGSYEGLKQKYPESFSNWGNTGPRTFVILKENSDIDQFRNKIKDFVKEKSENSNTTLIVQPYSETYLYNNYENGVLKAGRIVYVRLFSIIAVFILVIACINFMNLSTARASARAKEVGIKKVLGSSRKTLIIQFLGESLWLSLLSLIIALLIVSFLLPQFNNLTQKYLTLNFKIDKALILIGITLVTGLFAGSYPALYLSGFNPIVLKGKLTNSGGEKWIRKGLVVFQFSISIILIVSVIAVSKQIEFIQSQDPGFDKDNLIYFEAEGKIKNNKDAFISELRNIPGVLDVSSSDHILIGHQHTTSLSWDGKDNAENVSFEFAYTGSGIVGTFGMELVSGRSFSGEFGDEGSKIILNETAIATMGLKEPVGKVVNLWGENKEIIGILKDFHFESFHEKVKPMFLIFDPEQTSMIIARLETDAKKETILQIEKVYLRFNPGFLFDNKFLSQDYQTQYFAEIQVGVLSRYFAILAIIISCLGLFGLASFTAERRSKEIGIRKISGASESGIIYLLSNEIAKLVLWATIIALPIGYWISDKWLGNFAYSIKLSWWIFFIACLIAFVIALFTVSLQSWRAATRNPIESLRYE